VIDREPEIEVRRELRSGDLGEIIRMHGVLYPREHGLSPNMERHVANAVTAAAKAGWPENGAVWIVERDGEFAGSLALTDEGEGLAALRWFLFDPAVRGLGLGGRLVGELVDEAERRGFERIWLETLGILTTAARIYRAHGFVCVSERLGPPWGDPDVPYRGYELLLPRSGGLAVERRDDPPRAAGVTMLAEVDPLPGAKRQLAG
jgi:GNAT superfamily N-acetyltransferase